MCRLQLSPEQLAQLENLSEAVIRNVGWITGNLEDILVRLETPLPPPESPRPTETGTKG